jgi:hypothetical protein
MDQAQDSLYGVEHIGAWILAATAMVLAVLGTLVGLDVIELRETAEASPAGSNEQGETLLTTPFWDAAMLLFSAMTAGVLAFCLHANDHHRGRDLSTLPNMDRSLWGVEHTLAYLVGLGSVIYVVIGLLVGFNAISENHDQGDGLIWIWFGLAAATVTTALHAVRHHQVGIEQDYIISIVEERVGGRTVATGGTEPGVQRR